MGNICNKKLMAASLLEWTLGSETSFLNANDNKDLVEKAKKMGIELPSPDLAAFETVYCEVDKFNRNGVKFSKEVAQKGLKTLYGKQINWNHVGANQVCGYIIDSEIKGDKIYITGILFKSLFKDEFDEVIQLFAEKKLFVSFELWNKKEDGTSIVRNLGKGYKELTEFMAHGCALLLIDPKTGDPIPPACPQAQVKKLLASTKVIQEAEDIVEKIFEQDDRLVYAELATKEIPTCTNCKTCTCKMEGGTDTIMEEIQLNKDEKAEEVKVEEAKKKTCPECHQEVDEKDMEDEMCAVCKKKKQEKAQETPEQAQVEQPEVVEEPKVEAAVTEPIVEEKVTEAVTEVAATEVAPEQAQVVEQPVEVAKEEVKVEVEDANVTVTTTQTVQTVNTDTPAQDVITTEVKQEQVTVDKDGKEIQKVEVEHKEVVTYTYEQFEEKVAEAKAELEAKLAEKDTEISNLKKELEQKTQEIATLTIKETKQPVLTVGNILPTADKYREIQNGIDAKAFPKK